MKRLARIIALVFCAACGAQAYAAALNCVGSVSDVLIQYDGTLSFRPGFRGDFIRVCNVSVTDSAGVTPATCLTWFATLKRAQERQVDVQYFFSDVPYTCGTLPTWASAPSPNFVSQP